MRKTHELDIFDTPEFFKVLRKEALKKYEKAISKFVTGVKQELVLSEAATIPDTVYGFWITDDGYIPVNGPTGHERVAKDRLGTDIKGALAAGWIRVVSKLALKEKALSINVDRGAISNRTAGLLRALALSDDFGAFTLDIGPGEHHEWKRFSDVKWFLRAFNEIRRPLQEVYQEEESTFTHDDVEYDLNKLFRLLDDAESYDVPVDALDWILDYDPAVGDYDFDDRTEKADVTVPIIVSWWFDSSQDQHRLVVLDGIHRVQKAKRLGLEFLPGHYVDEEELVLAK